LARFDIGRQRQSGRRVVLASIVIAVAVSGCSSASSLLDKWKGEPSSRTQTAGAGAGDGIPPEMIAVDKAEPVASLYNKGLDQMKNEEYRAAAKSFGEVERQHPYSAWATKAIIMQAYSQYMRNSYDESIASAQRFITLHPGHRDAPYAYYLAALCYYEQIVDVRRDQTNTQRALASLEEVSRRFPGTAYAQDADAKAVLARDHLAGKEMEVGRYYVEKGAYLSGINRFKRVVTNYQTTSHTPEALYRLTESYLALGVQSEAQTAAAVLGHNYPNSEWYRDAYAILQNDGLLPAENKKSWISRALASMNPF
jgi:outer membrane protein assembly factor BamD